MNPRLNLARRDPSGPQFRILQGVHETFAGSLATALSTFLQTEIKCDLGDISVEALGDFLKTLSAPACLITMGLRPRPESMLLRLDSLAVLTLLEFLLGGKADSGPAAPRGLTEIEWSLLEEIVRVMVRPLGDAWSVFHKVEFEVESLGSDPSLLACPDPVSRRCASASGFNSAAMRATLRSPYRRGFSNPPLPRQIKIPYRMHSHRPTWNINSALSKTHWSKSRSGYKDRRWSSRISRY